MSLTRIDQTARSGAEIHASLMDAVGTPQMNRALFECANRVHRVDEIFGFKIVGEAAPQPIGWMGARADAFARVSRYADSFYRFDPMLRELRCAPRKPGALLRTTRASAIADDEYRWYCYDLPGLAEKISVARPTGQGWKIINFYRRDRYDACEVAALAEFGVFALAAVAKHGHLLPQPDVGPSPGEPAQRIAALLRQRFPGLSGRGAEVCSLSLLGAHSSDIGKTLGVAPSTVLTYRRRAYERLGISSAGELVAHLLP